MDQEDLTRRFDYYPATSETGPRHELVRAAACDFARRVLELVPEGREKALAVTKIEEAMMWANAGIARNPVNPANSEDRSPASSHDSR